ncbi:MAG: trigger factor [Syntrophomonadales bacterium]
MKTKLERIERNEVALEIEVEADRLEQAMQKAYRKVVTKVNIPGFRKGKAPRQVLEAYLGKEALFEDALEEVIPQAYDEAVKETEIEPVSQPKIDVVQIEDGKPLIFKANVIVKPEVKLGTVTGLKVEIPRHEVSEEDVEQRLQAMRNRYAKLITAEEGVPAENGDVLNINFRGFIDDEPFPGGMGEDYSLELGSNTFIPGFEEQLVGAVTGEEKEVKVTFPEEYHADDLKGKDARFEVTINQIQKRELSPLDDDFARDVSEFDTLEELKSDLRKNLEEEAATQTEGMIRQRLVAQAVEHSEIDVPEEMIESQTDLLLQRFEERLFYQGMKLEDYVQMAGISIEQMRQDMRPQAEQSVRENLVLETIAKQMDLKVTDEDFDKQIEKAAQEFGMEADAVRPSLEGSRERIEYGILLDKAVDYMKEHADITVIDEQTGDSEENSGEGK